MLFGWQVDQVCREYIVEKGFGDKFPHRTGHSIGEDLHGRGANIDNLETKDDRQLIPRICFSIEPGIYLQDEFGIRSEVNVYLSDTYEVIVTGTPMQESIIPILA